MLIMITGLPGTGKTTYAMKLAKSIEAIHLNSDIVRAQIGKRGHYDKASKAAVYNEMQNHAIINVLERIKSKTLIIGGDRDNIIPNYLQFIFKKFIKDSEIYILNEGSHVPQADFPDKVNERIKLFLDRVT